MTVVQLREKITIFAAWLSNFVELFRHWPSPQRSFCTLTQSNSNTSVLHISLVSAGRIVLFIFLPLVSRWALCAYAQLRRPARNKRRPLTSSSDISRAREGGVDSLALSDLAPRPCRILAPRLEP
jgi:hypothetical protein